MFEKDVGYPEFLNIRPYMSQSSGDPVMYGLYAVLVHSGYSCHAGHYYCYIKVCLINYINKFNLSGFSAV